MRFDKFCSKRRICAVWWLLVINIYVCCAGVSNNSDIVRSSTIEANHYEVYCDSSTSTSSTRTATTNKRTCVRKRIDCSCDNNSGAPFQSTKNTCTIYCDSVSSCDNSIITGLGCYNTIIIAPSTNTSIINMTLHNINSKHITIKTSSSFINSTIIIHPNTNKLEIDSKIFANNNVITNFAHNYNDRYQKMSKYNLTTETISTDKKKTTKLKTHNFLLQLFENTMVFVDNKINVNPKSINKYCII